MELAIINGTYRDSMVKVPSRKSNKCQIFIVFVVVKLLKKNLVQAFFFEKNCDQKFQSSEIIIHHWSRHPRQIDQVLYLARFS